MLIGRDGAPIGPPGGGIKIDGDPDTGVVKLTFGKAIDSITLDVPAALSFAHSLNGIALKVLFAPPPEAAGPPPGARPVNPKNVN